MRHRPLLVWAAGFAAGVATHAMGWGTLGVVLGAAILGVLLLAVGGRRWGVAAIGIALTGLSAGALRLTAFQAISTYDVSHWADRLAPVTITGTVVSDPEERRGGRLALRLRAERISGGDWAAPAVGEAYISVSAQARRSATPDYGDRVALTGTLETPTGATNPGGFSWRDYLARRAVFCQLRVKRPGGVQTLGATALNPFLRFAWGVRRHILTAVTRSLPPTQAALLSGILLGKRTDLPPDLMADFVHTGTVHILASAGLHVGIVAFWLFLLFERLTLPRKLSAALMIATLWLYALMAGGRPSVSRAVLMATIYFAAILFEREPDLPTTLAAAALVILCLQPTALLEAGFQMSFLTVLTLALLMPVWNKFWRRRIEYRISSVHGRKAALWAMELTGLSLLAQVGAAPIVAATYNEFSLSGLLANALVVPTLFLLIPLGFIGALLWGIWHATGAALLTVTAFGLRFIAFVVRTLGEGAWSYRALPTPSPLGLGLFYAIISGGAYAFSRRLAAPPSGPAGRAPAGAAAVAAVAPDP